LNSSSRFALRSPQNRCQPGDVPARVCQACDKPARNGIARCRHDDGDGPSGVLSCLEFVRHWCKDHVNLESDQLVCQVGKPIITAKSGFNDKVLALHITELPQPLAECVGAGRGQILENTNPKNFLQLLCFGYERSGKQHNYKRYWQCGSFLHCAPRLGLFITPIELKKSVIYGRKATVSRQLRRPDSPRD